MILLRWWENLNTQTTVFNLNGGLIKIEQTQKPKKYKHDDEDAWLKDHPGKEFKPFDPERKLAHKLEEK